MLKTKQHHSWSVYVYNDNGILLQGNIVHGRRKHALSDLDLAINHVFCRVYVYASAVGDLFS